VTRTAPPRGPETDALLAVLTAAGVLVGDAMKPPGAGFPDEDTTLDFTGYAVLFQGVTIQVDGPVSDANADVIAEHQLTSVGLTRPQASYIADKARAALLNGDVAVPGRCVQLVEWTSGHPVTRDDDVTPPLFYAIDIYAITTSPA
jgi:hypothetical protein